MALVGAVVDNWDTWWVVLAICGTMTGLWWAIGSMYVEEEPEPKPVDAASERLGFACRQEQHPGPSLPA